MRVYWVRTRARHSWKHFTKTHLILTRHVWGKQSQHQTPCTRAKARGGSVIWPQSQSKHSPRSVTLKPPTLKTSTLTRTWVLMRWNGVWFWMQSKIPPPQQREHIEFNLLRSSQPKFLIPKLQNSWERILWTPSCFKSIKLTLPVPSSEVLLSLAWHPGGCIHPALFKEPLLSHHPSRPKTDIFLFKTYH